MVGDRPNHCRKSAAMSGKLPPGPLRHHEEDLDQERDGAAADGPNPQRHQRPHNTGQMHLHRRDGRMMLTL